MRKKNIPNPFKTAIENTPDIATCYKIGLQGLGKHSKKIELADTAQCDGSVNIDDNTIHLYPNDNRWDYAFSYKSEVFFVEIHTANTREVNTMLKKLQWLKDWLIEHAPEINKLKAKETPFVWIQSNDFHIPKTSPQYRKMVQKGMKPIAKLVLD
jgi:hypothetical protein